LREWIIVSRLSTSVLEFEKLVKILVAHIKFIFEMDPSVISRDNEAMIVIRGKPVVRLIIENIYGEGYISTFIRRDLDKSRFYAIYNLLRILSAYKKRKC